MGVSTVILDSRHTAWLRGVVGCLLGAFGLGAITGILGCNSDTVPITPPHPETTYWALTLNQHAVNLALRTTSGAPSPYDTIRLVATPRSASGAILSTTGRVTYQSADSTVTVDSTGLVTAHYITSGTRVIASAQDQGLTLADTVFVQVTDTAPRGPLSTFVLQAAVGTSAHCHFLSVPVSALQDCGPLTLNAMDTEGDTLSSATVQQLLITYTSSNPLIASVDPTGAITTTDTGHVTFIATTWAYGVSKSDSVSYVIAAPKVLIININAITPVGSLTPVLVFDHPVTTVAVNGAVSWSNPFEQPIDVVFDDSTAVDSAPQFFGLFGKYSGAGNIPPFHTDTTFTDTSVFAQGAVGRSFPVPGTYRYHSRLYPTSMGVINVVPDQP